MPEQKFNTMHNRTELSKQVPIPTTPKFGDIPKKILHELKSNEGRERIHRKQHPSHERKHLEQFESQDQFLSKEEL